MFNERRAGRRPNEPASLTPPAWSRLPPVHERRGRSRSDHRDRADNLRPAESHERRRRLSAPIRGSGGSESSGSTPADIDEAAMVHRAARADCQRGASRSTPRRSRPTAWRSQFHHRPRSIHGDCQRNLHARRTRRAGDATPRLPSVARCREVASRRTRHVVQLDEIRID